MPHRSCISLDMQKVVVEYEWRSPGDRMSRMLSELKRSMPVRSLLSGLLFRDGEFPRERVITVCAEAFDWRHEVRRALERLGYLVTERLLTC